MRLACRHCGVRRSGRGRGLCYPCHRDPLVRDLYRCRNENQGLSNCVCRTPPAPTDALPGSAEKIQVLEERQAANQVLWHPGDAGMEQE